MSGVQQTLDKIREGISEEIGKYEINEPQMGLINPVGWIDTRDGI
jgi:hypothetical protein